MSDYTEIVARVLERADRLYGLPDEDQLYRVSPPTAERLGADMRALCTAVETLERERDQSDADERLAVANADRMTDQVIALTAEVERLRGDAERWRYYASVPQTALLLGSKLDPNEHNDWVAECNRLADAARRALGGTDAI